MGLVTDWWGGSLFWWLIGGRGGDWWSDLFMWISNCKVGWLTGFVVGVGFGHAWGGFDRFNLLEMGFSKLEIFFFFWIGCVVFLDWFGTLGF